MRSLDRRSTRMVALGLGLGATALLSLALLLGVPAETRAASPPVGAAVGVVSEQVGKGRPRPVAGAVVYLEGARVGAPRPVREPRVIQQRNLQFQPQVTVVMKGDRVEFPNKESNSVDHNVFSPGGPGKVGFDLGRYGKGKSESWVFTRTGDYDIYCNLHPAMKAKVKVVDTPYYATTDAAGAFRIAQVPVGDYVVRVWRPYSLEESSKVTVVAGADSAAALLKFTSAPSTPGRHKRLDGTRYPDY